MADPDIIRSGSFADGFAVGWRTVRGTTVMMPMVPMAPMTRMGKTAFLMGVKKGVERAIGKDLDDLR